MMEFLQKIVSNDIINIGAISFIAAQLLKIIIVAFTSKKMDFSRVLGAGGMPSSHSALVVGASFAILRLEGFGSPLFALSVIVALVIMYDAAGVRKAAGDQAKILNHLVNEWGTLNSTQITSDLKELLGHTKLEVYAGALLGAVVSFTYFFIKY
ncbi:MAG: divergent PAP2 family protein [Clostridia bacterium]